MHRFRALLLFVAGMSISACSEDPPSLADTDWLYPIDACPADVMPARETPLIDDYSYCYAQVEPCWQDCRRGNGEACYSLANYFQSSDPESDLSSALFLRSCALGVVSGCTNRAAGLLRTERVAGEFEIDGNACSNRSFELGCELHDAWACTMYGASLTRGIGIPVDHDLAMEILPRACELSEDDEACLYAQQLLAEIEAARQ